ncbi:MAG: glycosyltransferase [Pleurocapsa sp.]
MSRPKQLSNYLNWLVILLIGSTALYSLSVLRNNTEYLALMGWDSLVVLGAIGVWRWSWLLLHALRSAVYRLWQFPRWRSQANRFPLAQLPPLAIVIPTYQEKPWITERVFQAIAREAKTLPHPVTLVAVTTSEEIEAIAYIVKSAASQAVNFFPVLDPNNGKRGALALGLEVLSNVNFPSNGVVALMDGDSELELGSLRLSLPFFPLFPNLGGLTTNERPEVYGSRLFSEWLQLRFGQRHQYMCSHALARKVLCLTGRCSFFRATAALEPSFRNLLVNDYINDWLWGQFRFFSGDDKSTWYWLVRQGYDMLYLPDVMVTTIETISGSVWERAYQNMRRWSGNMFRNGSRVLGLGIRRVGFFTWLCVLDQRISIWTSLISPGILIVTLIERNWFGALLLSCWLLTTRCFYLFLVFWDRKSRLKIWHLPLLFLSQWGTSAIKIWTQMNLAQQKWTNRHGNKGRSAGGISWQQRLINASSRCLLISQVFIFVVFLLWQYGSVNVTQDLAGWHWQRQQAVVATEIEIIEARDYGIVPSDRADDSQALQTLLDSLPTTGTIQINLPLGEIDLFQPLVINRSHTYLVGKGTQGTVIKAIAPANNTAIFTFQPQSGDRLKDLKLSSLTISATNVTASVEVNHTSQVVLSYLRLTGNGVYGLILNDTKNVTVEYVALDGVFQKQPILQRDQLKT